MIDDWTRLCKCRSGAVSYVRLLNLLSSTSNNICMNASLWSCGRKRIVAKICIDWLEASAVCGRWEGWIVAGIYVLAELTPNNWKPMVLFVLSFVIFASLLHCCAIATALWYRQNISQRDPTFGSTRCVKFLKKVENHKEKKSLSSESIGGWLKKEEDGFDLGQI